MDGAERAYRAKLTADLERLGVAPEVARKVAGDDELVARISAAAGAGAAAVKAAVGALVESPSGSLSDQYDAHGRRLRKPLDPAPAVKQAPLSDLDSFGRHRKARTR